MDNKEYIIETKFDGERMQLHKKEGEYKYYSRRWVLLIEGAVSTDPTR